MSEDSTQAPIKKKPYSPPTITVLHFDTQDTAVTHLHNSCSALRRQADRQGQIVADDADATILR